MNLTRRLTVNLPKRNLAILFFVFFGLFGLADLSSQYTTEKLLLFCFFYLIVYILAHQLLLHRYFTHRQFKVNTLLHYIFCFWSTLACMGSPLTYRFDHRLHHKYSDTENDIHGPKIGLFRAFHSYKTEEIYKVNSERINDKVLIFVHNNYYKILFSLCLVLLVISTNLFLYLCLAIAVNVLVSDIFNYLNHYRYTGAYRNYNTKDNSTNHILWGYLAFCWHNNHHRYPFNPNEQSKWWEVDLLYQLIIRWIQK